MSYQEAFECFEQNKINIGLPTLGVVADSRQARAYNLNTGLMLLTQAIGNDLAALFERLDQIESRLQRIEQLLQQR